MGQVGVGGRGVENVQESRVRKDGIVTVLPRFKNFFIKGQVYSMVIEKFGTNFRRDIT